tara:strand:- start:650 stop:1069 length:420 start_codon:yes stop_codon:yes gene_type:complete
MEVAVALILNNENKVLIAQRGSKQTHAGLWEFPGGKVEANETPEMALVREIQEEVNLHVLSARFFGFSEHQYSKSKVSLHFYLVQNFTGVAQCRESQSGLKWIDISSLSEHCFPEANDKIIQELQSYFVTAKSDKSPNQ